MQNTSGESDGPRSTHRTSGRTGRNHDRLCREQDHIPGQGHHDRARRILLRRKGVPAGDRPDLQEAALDAGLHRRNAQPRRLQGDGRGRHAGPDYPRQGRYGAGVPERMLASRRAGGGGRARQLLALHLQVSRLDLWPRRPADRHQRPEELWRCRQVRTRAEGTAVRRAAWADLRVARPERIDRSRWLFPRLSQ